MLKSAHKVKSPAENIQVSDDAPEKDGQLYLELEMDDEVKEIINYPEKFADTYLDVTVIKPKPNHPCTKEKKIMSSEQVKQFITAINLRKPQEIIEVNEEKQPQRSAGDYIRNSHKQKISDKLCTTPNSIGDHLKIRSSDCNNSRVDDKVNIQQIYTTAKTFTELNSLFECKKRRNNEKFNSPCLCHNCAIVGVVTDSQKKPFCTEPMKDPAALLTSRKANSGDKTKREQNEDHQQCQYYFKYLSEKIRILEQRLAAQEQKAVPKEYFKKIVTKLLNHISKVTGYGGQIKIETNVPSVSTRKIKQPSVSTVNRPDHIPRQKFVVTPVTIHNERVFKDGNYNGESIPDANTSLWKWGEDILKPGIDLKNKLISVMEDTINCLKKSKEKPKDDELKHFIHEFSNNLYKTVNERVKDETSHRLDLAATIDFNERNNRMKNLNRKMGIHLDEPISVTYVNSQILRWQDTQTTFKFESDKESVNNVMDNKQAQEIHKMEFIKTIRHTKQEDKIRLWHSIWNQARKNGHTKHNKVTVQIPDKSNPKNQSVEVEYSLGDLEYLLLGSKTGRR